MRASSAVRSFFRPVPALRWGKRFFFRGSVAFGGFGGMDCGSSGGASGTNHLGQALLDLPIALGHLIQQMTVGFQGLPEDKQVFCPPIPLQSSGELLFGAPAA